MWQDKSGKKDEKSEWEHYFGVFINICGNIPYVEQPGGLFLTKRLPENRSENQIRYG